MMKNLPTVGWLLMLLLAFFTLSGVVLAFVGWDAKTEILATGLGVSCLSGVCLFGTYRRVWFVRYLAVAILLMIALGFAGSSLFLIVVGQQEPDVMVMARSGLLFSLLMVGFSVAVLFSRKLRAYFSIEKKQTGESEGG